MSSQQAEISNPVVDVTAKEHDARVSKQVAQDQLLELSRQQAKIEVNTDTTTDTTATTDVRDWNSVGGGNTGVPRIKCPVPNGGHGADDRAAQKAKEDTEEIIAAQEQAGARQSKARLEKARLEKARQLERLDSKQSERKFNSPRRLKW